METRALTIHVAPDAGMSAKQVADTGERMAAALEKVAAHASIDIEDPVEWQRKIRQDRPLPGRG